MAIVIGDNADNVIDGTDRDDVVLSGKGADTVDTGDGDDLVLSGNGADTVYSGDGDDVVLSGKGADTVDTGDGDDLVLSGNGADTVYSGDGDDVVLSGNGADTVDAGNGDDVVLSGNGADTVNAGDGDDVVYAGRGDDTVDGGAGSDLISADKGDDTVVHIEAENLDTYDVYHGGSGHDTLRLVLTQSVFNSVAFQADLALYQAMIDSTGSASGVWSSIGIETYSFEVIEIEIEGNTPPTASPIDLGAVDEDGSLVITAADLLVGAEDPDGDPLTITALSVQSGSGTLTDNGDGTWTYDPADNDDSDVTFAYTVSDGDQTASSMAILDLTPVNDAPTAADGSDATDEDVALTGTLPAASDIDGDDVTYGPGSTIPANGQVVINPDGSFTYTPDADFNGTDTFSYIIDDGNGGTNEYLFEITVDPINDAPEVDQGIGDQASDEDAAWSFAVPADAFADIDEDSLTLTARLANGDPLPIWLAFDGTTFNGTPPQDFNGAIDITVIASDGNETVETTFTLAVNPVNDAPEVDQGIGDQATNEDTAFSFVVPADAFADIDGDALGLNATLANGDPLPSWLDFNGAGFTGTPPQNFNGSVDVKVIASDGELTAETTFTLVVNPVNDAPVAADDAFSGVEDTVVTGNVLDDNGNGIDDDLDGDSLSVVPATIVIAGAGTVALLADGSFTFTPLADFNGIASFDYTLTDDDLTDTGTATITLAPVNDAPTAADGSDATDEDVALTGTLPAASDIDGDDVTYGPGSTIPANGQVVINPDGSFTYTPDADFNGTDTFSYIIDDGNGGTNEYLFEITVDPINDAPEVDQGIGDQASDEDAAWSFAVPADAFADIDEDSLTLTARLANGDPLPIWLAFDGTTFNGTPPQDFNGAIDITVIASDGNETVETTFTLAVNPVNDAPEVDQGIGDQATNEDTAFSFVVPADAFADIDGDALGLNATLANGDPLPSWLDFNGAGFTGTPPQNFNGSVDVKVIASDGELTAETTFTLVVNPVNDAPETDAAAGQGDEDGGAIAIALTGTDIDGTVNLFNIDTLPTNGVLYSDAALTTPLSDGEPIFAVGNAATVYFVPDADFNGQVTFTYTAIDNEIVSDPTPATATITVDAVDDPASGFVDIVGTFEPGQTLTADTSGVFDPEGISGFNYQWQLEVPGTGFVDITGATAETYTLPNLALGSYALQVVVEVIDPDGNVTTLTSAPEAFDVVNAAPVAVADSYVVDEDATLTVAADGVLANDTDREGDSLSAMLVDDVTNGTLSFLADGSFTYTPDADFSGADSFTYKANDGTDDGNTVTVDITVNPINDVPLALDDSFGAIDGADIFLVGDGAAYSALNNGDGTFAVNSLVSDSLVRQGADIGDLNGDGSLDVFVVHNGRESVWINDGLGNLTEVRDVTTADDRNNFDVELGDINGDGVLDAVVASRGNNPTRIWINDGNANFTAGDNLSYTSREPTTFDVAVGDLNRDGHLDIVEANNGVNLIWFNQGGGSFSLANTISFGDADGDSRDVTLADLNGDNYLDMFVGNNDGANTVWINNGDPVNPGFTEISGGLGNAETRAVALGDLNGDGTIDAFVANSGTPGDPDTDNDGAPNEIWLNDGSGNFSLSDNNGVAIGNNTTLDAELIDFDGDGDLDALTGNDDASQPNLVWLNDGDGNFTSDGTSIGTFAIKDVALADFDGDAALSGDETHSLDVLANDFDADVADTLTIVSINPGSLASALTIAPDGRSILFDPGAAAPVNALAKNEYATFGFSYTVSDGNGGTDIANAEVTVRGVNIAPVAVADSYTVLEDETLTVAAEGVLINDSDTDNDVLRAVLVDDVDNGVLVLNGDGSFTYTPDSNFNGGDSFTYRANDGTDDGNVVVVNITVDPVDDDPDAVDDAFEVITGNLVIVDILGNDIHPDGGLFAITHIDGIPVNPDDTVTTASGSTVELNADGTIEFLAAPYDLAFGETASETFTYSVADTITGLPSNTATVSVSILSDQIPPVANDDLFFGGINTVITGNLFADNGNGIDFDPDGGSLSLDFTFDVTTARGNQIFVEPNGDFTFTPVTDFTGVETFEYTVFDGQRVPGGPDPLSDTATVFISVDNSAPIANDDVVAFVPGSVVSGNLIGNNGNGADTDPDGDPLAAVAGTFTTAMGREIVIDENGDFTYDVTIGFAGSDTFEYTVTDGLLSDTATVTFELNQAPVVNDVFITVDEDNFNLVHAAFLDENGLFDSTIASDPEGSNLTITYGDASNGRIPLAGFDSNNIPVAPGGGSVSVNIQLLAAWISSYSYFPSPNFNGTDSFEYTATDEYGLSSTATIHVTVNPVNDDPVAADDLFTIDEDGFLSGDLLADNGNGIDSDIDGDQLSLLPGSGTTSGGGSYTNKPDGSFIYTPAANFFGTDSFDYVLSDGTVTDTGTVTITVNSVEDAPTPVDDAFTTDEDVAFSGNVLADNGSGADSDGDGEPVTAVAGTYTSVEGGTITLGANGDFTYTPASGFSGTDSFTYHVTDGANTSTGTVTMTVTAQSPVAADDTVVATEDTTLTGNVLADNGNGVDTDPNGDDLFALPEVVDTIKGGVVTIFSSGVFIYTPAADFFGTDSFTYGINDRLVVTEGEVVYSDVGTVTVEVAPTDDAPVAADDMFTGIEGVTITGNLFDDNGAGVDNDVDGDALYAIEQSVTTSEGSVFILNADGTFTYTSGTGFLGAESIDYTIADVDGGGGTDTATVTFDIAVRPTIAGDDAGAVVEDEPTTTIAGALTIDDPDGVGFAFDALTFAATDYGQFELNDGNWTYTLFNSSDAVQGLAGGQQIVETYEITAGGGLISEFVDITITGDEDPTIISGDRIGLLVEDSPTDTATGSLFFSDIDTATDALRFEAKTEVVNGTGTFTIDADGNWQFLLDNDSDQVESLNVDDSLFQNILVQSADGSVIAAVGITIDGSNDAPIAFDDTFTIAEDSALAGNVLDDNGSGADSDVDDEALIVTAGTFTTQQGFSYTIASNGAFTYQPPANFFGTDSFTYDVTDGSETSTGTVTLNVTAVDDPATIVGDLFGSVGEDAPGFGSSDPFAAGTVAFSDIDNSTDGLAFEAKTETLSGIGTFAIDADGNWRFDLDNDSPEVQSLGSFGFLSPSFDVQSADGAISESVNIQIWGAQDTAIITGDATGTVDALGPASGPLQETAGSFASGQLNVADVDAGESSFRVIETLGDDIGLFTYTEDGAWTFDLDEDSPTLINLLSGQTLTRTYQMTSLDGSASEDVEITVTRFEVFAPDIVLNGTPNVAEEFAFTKGDGWVRIVGFEVGQETIRDEVIRFYEFPDNIDFSYLDSNGDGRVNDADEYVDQVAGNLNLDMNAANPDPQLRDDRVEILGVTELTFNDFDFV